MLMSNPVGNGLGNRVDSVLPMLDKPGVSDSDHRVSSGWNPYSEISIDGSPAWSFSVYFSKNQTFSDGSLLISVLGENP